MTTKEQTGTREEIYSSDDQAEAAFINCDKHTLGDLKLEPFTLQRQWAAEAMFLRYGSVDKAGIEFLNKHGFYPGASRDVAIVLWLCSVKESEVDEAYRNPSAGAQKAAEWAKEHNLTITKNDQWEQAWKVFVRIISEVDASRSVPVETNESPPSNPNA
jgi:hypothetical protein